MSGIFSNYIPLVPFWVVSTHSRWTLLSQPATTPGKKASLLTAKLLRVQPCNRSGYLTKNPSSVLTCIPAENGLVLPTTHFESCGAKPGPQGKESDFTEWCNFLLVVTSVLKSSLELLRAEGQSFLSRAPIPPSALQEGRALWPVADPWRGTAAREMPFGSSTQAVFVRIHSFSFSHFCTLVFWVQKIRHQQPLLTCELSNGKVRIDIVSIINMKASNSEISHSLWPKDWKLTQALSQASEVALCICKVNPWLVLQEQKRKKH